MNYHKFILDSLEWSFSKLNSYKLCPRMFYLAYIQCLERTNNAFAEWGSFCHLLFEKYFNGKLEFYELSHEYIQNYDMNVITRFPPNPYVDLNQRYYDVGKMYFDHFEGLYENCEKIGIEEEIHIKIGKFNFVGFIDLILRDANGIFIIDHKSKSKFKTDKEKAEYLVQLYLYSIYIHKKYGEYPYKLIFNMFRANEFVEEKFNSKQLELAKKWVVSTINEIYNDVEFKTKHNDFFCSWLCNMRSYCACSDEYLGR